MEEKQRAPRNRTLTLTAAERAQGAARLTRLGHPAAVAELLNRMICQDLFAALPLSGKNRARPGKTRRGRQSLPYEAN